MPLEDLYEKLESLHHDALFSGDGPCEDCPHAIAHWIGVIAAIKQAAAFAKIGALVHARELAELQLRGR